MEREEAEWPPLPAVPLAKPGPRAAQSLPLPRLVLSLVQPLAELRERLQAQVRPLQAPPVQTQTARTLMVPT